MAIKYVAEIDRVHEVSLRGDALVEPWAAELSALGLQAACSIERVPMMLSATSARFRGLPFREFSISVLARENDTGTEGWYLAHAFNSSRFFAWVERTMFATPYYFGGIEVKAPSPAAVRMTAADARVAFEMSTNALNRQPLRRGPESWEGPLFLPSRRKADAARYKWFYAKLEGDADVYSFLPRQDQVGVTPTSKWPALAKLAAADFQGTEWLLRTNAFHAKSRTYERPTSKQLA